MRLRTLTTLAIAIFTAIGVTSCSNKKNNRVTITILQTTDIHGQLDTHEEMFVDKVLPSCISCLRLCLGTLCG